MSKKLDFEGYITVLVNKDSIYAFKQFTDDPILIHYTDLSNKKSIKSIQKAKPLTGRHYTSLVNFRNRYLFISGGEN